MNKKLAPIVLFTHSRPWHTEQTLEALLQNELANESKLYIYCDGPKVGANSESLENIAKVRNLVKKKKWCRDVQIIESENNKGLATSIRSGVSEILKKHGKVIVMEDDLLTSPAFLHYMNNALDYYEKRETVFSISAYCLPDNKLRIPDDYGYDVFVSLRNSSWGWGTWSDRWGLVDWDTKQFRALAQNKNIKDAFNRGGDDVFGLLEAMKNGTLDIWSIQFTLAHFANHAVSIVPTKSYVDNIGLDATGEHCMASPSLRNNTLSENKNIRFLDILYQDSRIINAFYSAYCNRKRPLWKKIINRISRIVGGRNIFIIKKKIYQ